MRPINKTTATLVRPHLFSTLCPTPLGNSPVWVFPKRTCYTEEWDDAEDEPLDDVHEGGGHLRVVVVEDQVRIRVHGDLSLELPMILREVSKLWLGLWLNMYDLCVYQQSHARTSRRFVCSSTFQLNNLCRCRSLWQISLSKYQIS